MFWQLSDFLRKRNETERKQKSQKRKALYFLFPLTCIILSLKCQWRANHWFPATNWPSPQRVAREPGVWLKQLMSCWDWKNLHYKLRTSTLRLTVWIKCEQENCEHHIPGTAVHGNKKAMLSVSATAQPYSKNRPVNWIAVMLSHLQPVWKWKKKKNTALFNSSFICRVERSFR